MDLLKFSKANAKIEALSNVPAIMPYLDGKRKVYSIDLLSGWSCPYADECLSKVHIVDGRRKIIDGKNTKFRCFSASQEALYPKVYAQREYNFNLLKNSDNMFLLIHDSLPKNLGVCRIHVAGDFFNRDYFHTWIMIARAHPSRLFYAYTKSLPYWLDARKDVNNTKNLVMTASYGGRCDKLIKKHRLRYAKVIFSKKDAGNMEIDHDDSHAADPSKKRQSFALLLHGTQPAGTDAAKALSDLKGEGSYSRKKKK